MHDGGMASVSTNDWLETVPRLIASGIWISGAHLQDEVSDAFNSGFNRTMCCCRVQVDSRGD